MFAMNPMKIALVGGGPSSFYVASRLLSLTNSQQLRIHIYDRLWSPYGLVRYGVAPDHPEVKNCTHKFDTAAADSRLRFFGNVNVGSHPTEIQHAISLPMSSLMANYTHLVVGAGCTVPILHPAIPPSDHCIPALNLVHWYTKHPARPPPPPLDKAQHVSIIGQGNVSLDIARMLLSRVSDLAKYDVPDSVLDVLSRSRVRHVSIIGRRGPFQSAFTAKELREMLDLPGVAIHPIDHDLLEAPEADNITRQRSRIISLLKRGSRTPATDFVGDYKTWSLEFFRSPTGLSSSRSASSRFELSLGHTILDKNSRAIPSGGTSTLPTDLVVTSLGYRSDPKLNWYDPSLGYVRNVSGRVVDEAGNTLQNVYASGWAARGAKGVLASTMMDAYALAETVLSDATENPEALLTSDSTPTHVSPSAGNLPEETKKRVMEGSPSDLEGIPREVEDGLRNGSVMTHADWKLIDQEEVRRGAQPREGKERERMEWEQVRDFVASNKASRDRV